MFINKKKGGGNYCLIIFTSNTLSYVFRKAIRARYPINWPTPFFIDNRRKVINPADKSVTYPWKIISTTPFNQNSIVFSTQVTNSRQSGRNTKTISKGDFSNMTNSWIGFFWWHCSNAINNSLNLGSFL